MGILNPNFEVLEKNITRVEPKPRNWQGKGVDGGAWEEIRVGRKQIIGVSKWS